MNTCGPVRAILLWASLSLGAALIGIPAPAQSGQENIQKLLDRIDRIEKRLASQEEKNAQLESQIRALQGGGPAPAAPQVLQAAPPAPASPGAVPQQATDPKAARNPVTAKPSVELYGTIKLDAAHDSGQVYPGDYALYVQPPFPGYGARQQFNLTANQTRLGLNLKTPGAGCAVTTGKVEIDFYGGGAENKPNPMMRHAYLQVEWPASGISLLAGQTSDVISPLAQPTVNYSVGWYAGNIGYRHPQLRLTKEFKFGGGDSLLLQGALVRTMGHLASERNTGVDAGFPTVQGRLAYSFPAGAGGKATLGISGHWGEEAYMAPAPRRPDMRFRSWSANLDLKVPLGSRISLAGEGFAGRDLDSYLGGSNEAVNLSARTATASAGGWLALSIAGSERITWNLGASVDDPRNSDLSPGSRSRNASVFGNGLFTIASSAHVLAEISYWNTDYLQKPGAHAFRVQLAFQYSF